MEETLEYPIEIQLPKIVVVGVGGGGSNSIDRLGRLGLDGVEVVAVNTDQIHLAKTSVRTKLLIGKHLTKGMGAGGQAELGRKCAEASRTALAEILKDADLVFVTVGLGGGTGTGAAPVVCEEARNSDAMVIGIATMPFVSERGRIATAVAGLSELRKYCDSVIVIDNERLLKVAPQMPLRQAFGAIDQLIADVIRGVASTITQPSLINLDCADVRTVMRSGCTATLLHAEGPESDPEGVVHRALNNPLMDIDYAGATGALIHITGGPKLSLERAHRVISGMTSGFDQSANVIVGARILPECDGSIKVFAIVTGVSSPHVLGPLAAAGSAHLDIEQMQIAAPLVPGKQLTARSA